MPICSPTTKHSQTLGANKGVALVTKRFQLQEKPACFRGKLESITEKLYIDLALVPTRKIFKPKGKREKERKKCSGQG